MSPLFTFLFVVMVRCHAILLFHGYIVVFVCVYHGEVHAYMSYRYNSFSKTNCVSLNFLQYVKEN